jgi:hypothetical protein
MHSYFSEKGNFLLQAHTIARLTSTMEDGSGLVKTMVRDVVWRTFPLCNKQVVAVMGFQMLKQPRSVHCQVVAAMRVTSCITFCVYHVSPTLTCYPQTAQLSKETRRFCARNKKVACFNISLKHFLSCFKRAYRPCSRMS